jgi:hypothetical protein
VKKIASWAVIATLGLFLLGCPEKDGPLEEAGEKLDEAADEVKDAVD